MNKVKRLIISLCLSGILLVAMLPQVIAADRENLNSLPNCTFSVKTGARAGEPAVIYNSDGVALYCLDMSLDMAYSTVYLNIRKGPTTESEIVDTVAPGYYFTRIAHSDFGWDLVLYESSYCFVWNEYLFSTTFLLNENSYTLAGGLYQLQSNDYTRSWGMFSAAAILVSVPVLIIFFCIQKYMVSGLTAGGVKGQK